MSIPLIIYWLLSAVILTVGVLSLWKGGPAERLGSALILAIVVIGRLVALVVPREAQPVLHLVEDGLTAIGLLAVAIRYASFWLGGAMLLYAALFTLHAAYFVLDRPQDQLYVRINDTCFLGVVAFMAAATALSWRARVRKRIQAQRAATATSPAGSEENASA